LPLHHEHEHELRHHFDDELDEIRRGLVQMGTLVVENTRRAGEAVLHNRLDLIAEVRRGDGPVNDAYSRLERQTFAILALQQPVAGDLRFLVATSRVLYEMERSGDLAVNIVNCLSRQEGFPRVAAIDAALAALVDRAAAVFAMGTEAIAAMDGEAGPRVDTADDEVDRLTSRLFSQIHLASDTLGLDAAIELTRVGRFLERIADHGVNIAENVTYVVTGHFPGDEPRDPA